MIGGGGDVVRAYPLGPVDVKQDASFGAKRADFGDVVDDSDLVVGEHDGNEGGVGLQCRLDVSDVGDTVIAGHPNVGHRRQTKPFEAFAGAQHAVVLQFRSDDVRQLLGARLATLDGQLLNRSGDSHGVRLASSTCEINLRR
eukprot:1195811-Prorocentrum_minimum.AAC.3